MQIRATAKILRKRHELFREVRSFFDARDFIEVHTPMLVVNPGLEPYLHHFETSFVDVRGRPTGVKRYLPTSPEYHLKKALALGIERLYEITRSFRNGELGPEHEPEFFMLEWYRHPGEYTTIADDFAALLATLAKAAGSKASWQHRQDLTVSEAFSKYCGLDLDGALLGKASSLTEQALKRALSPSIKSSDNFEDCFFKIMIEHIEPKLGFDGPLFLWDYPASMCAMARLKAGAEHLCERFEVYWRGIELANAFGELTQATEQRQRCLEDQQKRLQLYGHTPPLDEEFLASLEHLKHPAAGIAVGLERVLQCLLDAPSLQELIAFPHYGGV